MYYSNMIFSVLAFVALTHAHMEMSFPPPLRSKYNPLYLSLESGEVDYSMTSPLSGAAQFPCKGYQSDVGKPAAASVITWNQGAAVNFSIVGGASHDGGSCQASLSYDGGKSFTVIHSFVGGCPLTQNWDLTIPSDAPKGAALFAWSWYNEVGNREIYMNCASITIGAGSSKKRASSVAFSSRPGLFVANLANGCTTIEGQDVVFPDPGPDVTGTSTKGGIGYSGTCAAVNGIGGGSSGSSGSASGSVGGGTSSIAAAASSPAPAASSPAVSSPAPAATSPSPAASSPSPVATSSPVAISSSSEVLTIIPVTTSAAVAPSGFVTSTTGGSAPSSVASVSPVASVAASSSASGSAPASTGSASGVSASTDGQCSGSQTCAGSTYGQCCSQWGWCGVTTMHCGTGCMEAFSGAGACGGATANSTVPVAARVRDVKARSFFA